MNSEIRIVRVEKREFEKKEKLKLKKSRKCARATKMRLISSLESPPNRHFRIERKAFGAKSRLFRTVDSLLTDLATSHELGIFLKRKF